MTSTIENRGPESVALKSDAPPTRAVGRGSVANLAGSVVMAASTFGVTILITRSLSHADAGVFFSTTSLFLLACSVGMLGTNTALVYFVARSRALDRFSLVPHYFRTGARPVVALGVLLGVATFVAAPAIASVTNPDGTAAATAYLRVLSVLIPFAAIENVTLAALRGLGSMRATVLIEQVGRPLLQLGLVAVALVSPTWIGLAGAWAFPYAPAAVLSYLAWRRASSRLLRERSAPTAHPAGGADPTGQGVGRAFWRFSGPRALASVGQMVMQRVDIVLVAALAGAAEAAVYTAATRFLVVGQMGNRAISTAVQPRLAETLAHEDRAGTNHYYQTSTAWLTLLTWPLYLTLLCFGAVVMTVFGAGYQSGETVLVVLACTMLVSAGCGMVDMVLNMGGRTSWNLLNVFCALAANIALNLWLIPELGMLGAAISWAAAILIQNLLGIAQTGLVLGLHPFGRQSLLAAAAALVCFGLVEAVGRVLLGPTWTGLAASFAVGVICYAGWLFTARDTLLLADLLPRRARHGSHALP